MRNAETILGIIRERGRFKLPLKDVYRTLYQPDLYLQAYAKIYRNKGAMTPGVNDETADGMALAKIERIITLLREEKYVWSPTRRLYIEKKNSKKKRPLGLPVWSDKLLQEVVRLILEAYYEPQFSRHSHGFRPKRGCHSALQEIKDTWLGTTWFIEGDISNCFDSLDHTVMLDTLRENIHDNRFLRLISNLLKCGYLEDWTYHRTLSGTPQGGVLSPLLSNIYLDRLDKFVEHALLPSNTRGKARTPNRRYAVMKAKGWTKAKQGKLAEAKTLTKACRQMPSKDTRDPSYRRLRYIRYADDFLLGFAGPRKEAEVIKQQLKEFLQAKLRLNLSESKTLITHGRSEATRFLGYEIVVFSNDSRRSINGIIGLCVPKDIVMAKCRHYTSKGKPKVRFERSDDSVFTIISQFQQEYRGFAEYYQLAYNRSTRLPRLKWVMEGSLLSTLGRKLRLSPRKLRKAYAKTIQTPQGPRKVLEVIVPREGKKPLVARWGAITLSRPGRTNSVILNDQPAVVRNGRTELVKRLLADTCELCGSQENINVHHVRHIRDVTNSKGRPQPRWKQLMAERHRKTLVVCRVCHDAIHAGRPTRTRITGEPDDAKVSRPVRRGADGKGQS